AATVTGVQTCALPIWDQAAAVWVELGRFQAQHGDDAAAESAFAHARSASPSDPDALMAEAAYLEAKRKYADARDRYLRLLAQRRSEERRVGKGRRARR